jgi:copper(I)-binding protein
MSLNPENLKDLKLMREVMKLYTKLLLILGFLPAIGLAQPSIQIENAYIRELPPHVDTAAVYMTIHNTGQHPMTLDEIRTEVANSAMLHQTSMQNGMMTMEHVMSLELDGRTTVNLAPGGLHIMLMGLRQSLRAGDTINLTLHFANGLVLNSSVPIVRDGP